MFLTLLLFFPGNTNTIIQSSGTIMMLAAQYTVLKDIHGGHRNWQEMFGVVLVILSSMMAALINTYCAGNTQDGASEQGEEGEEVLHEEYTSLDGGQEEESSKPEED